MTREEALENKNRIQKEAVEAWVNSGYCGTQELATGSGKSKIALDCLQLCRDYWQDTRPMTLLVTPTESMRDEDWPAEFEKWGVSTDYVKIICQASLSKEKLERYELIIFDEYHNNTVPNLKRIAAVQQSHKPRMLGLTATLPDKANWPDEVERVDMLRKLIPSIYKLTTDEAVDLGMIADFEVQVLKFPLDTKLFNIKTGPKGHEWLTTEASHYVYLTKELQRAMYAKNESLKFMKMQARTQFIYNLESKSRLAEICMLKLQQNNKRTIVMAGSIEQANRLCGEAVYHSASTREYYDKFQAKEISLLGAVKALDEGVNLNNLEQLLVTQVQSGERRLIQRINKPVLSKFF